MSESYDALARYDLACELALRHKGVQVPANRRLLAQACDDNGIHGPCTYCVQNGITLPWATGE